jgi:hypothetical protein
MLSHTTKNNRIIRQQDEVTDCEVLQTYLSSVKISLRISQEAVLFIGNLAKQLMIPVYCTYLETLRWKPCAELPWGITYLGTAL